jgi:hypothetical protein
MQRQRETSDKLYSASLSRLMDVSWSFLSIDRERPYVSKLLDSCQLNMNYKRDRDREKEIQTTQRKKSRSSYPPGLLNDTLP